MAIISFNKSLSQNNDNRNRSIRCQSDLKGLLPGHSMKFQLPRYFDGDGGDEIFGGDGGGNDVVGDGEGDNNDNDFDIFP